MAVEYCHTGNHYIDLDWNCDGKYIENNEWICGDCIEQMEEKSGE